MKTINLYDHQQTGVVDSRVALRKFRSVCVVAPTGFGKTVLASHFVNSIKNAGKKVYFLVHRKELLDQTVKTFNSYGIPCGVIAAGQSMNRRMEVQCCSIDTLKNRMEQLPYPDFIIVDEAHHAAAAGYLRVLDYYERCKIIGLTGTPARLDGVGLGVAFQSLVPTVETHWLIDEGYLAKYKLFSIPGVASLKNKFTKTEAEDAVDKPSITGDIVSHWLQKARGRKTIMFAPSIKKSKELVQSFIDAGIRAIHVDGETPKQDRNNAMRRFAEGGEHGYDILSNVALFGEGFDIEANSGLPVTVSCMIDAAPTQSLSAWRQRCGRALRRQEGHAIILDHSGNFLRHGAPCDEIEWSLDGDKIKNKTRDSESDIAMKQCPECYHCHKPAQFCPSCDYEYITQSRKINYIEGELEEIDINEARAARIAQGKARTEADLMAQGMSQGRADHILQARKDKEKMRESLKELTRTATVMGLQLPFLLNNIMQMKPKELKLHITNINAMLEKV